MENHVNVNQIRASSVNGEQSIGGLKRPFDRVGGRGTGPAQFGVAALGGTAWSWAGADGGGAAPHNAGDAAVGGPRGADRSVCSERTNGCVWSATFEKPIAIFAGTRT